MTFLTPIQALQCVQSGDRVFIHSAAAAPQILIDALVQRAPDLRNVEIVHLHHEATAPYAAPEYKDSFRVSSLFIGPNVRKATNDSRADNIDYIPVFLSEVPLLFRRGLLKIDVALIQVSPPDSHGFCSLGVSVDASLAAVETARDVVAVINPSMPRSHGDGIVHVSKLKFLVEDNSPIFESEVPVPDAIQMAIGGHVASLIEDGATLQMGIGAIPNAVLAALGNHKDLGIHTEMFSDGVVDLVEKGIITGKYKKRHHGMIVSGFVMGSRRVYDFIDDNPQVRMLDIAYVNDTAVIRKQHKMTAVNSAIEVDMTGQVCADSIGRFLYSGVGGQMDFIRGASLAEGGKPIIALPSLTSKGESRIVPYLKSGAGVVTTRAHVHYIVTEYGIANLYGKSIRQRAAALLEIAHPDHRERLAAEYFGG
ncbi:MAG: acetyl-CoA hydrolase/transferase family protein [Bacteroidetes bacterium]|nr:acetyl-CoA hydrolase/transferase family protein [Bacteroidota bacterium]MBL0016693.1 acetyl-CoA hydrolase/transferase family protein [Bacteroidota bacterium]